MLAHLRYAWYILRHKWFVYQECCKLGIPWRGLTHDLSKLRPSEWGPYVASFYGRGPALKVEAERLKKCAGNNILVRSEDQWAAERRLAEIPREQQAMRDAFDQAWNAHQKRNRHHWQFYLLREDDPRAPYRAVDEGNAAVVYRGTGQVCEVPLPRKLEFPQSAYCPDLGDPPSGLLDREQGQKWALKQAEQLALFLNTYPRALEMAREDALEMVADWRGAGRAVGKPDTLAWYKAHRKQIVLAAQTRALVEGLLGYKEE